MTEREIRPVVEKEGEKDADVRFDLDRIEDPGLIAAVNAVYPEAVPVGKAPSIFDRVV